MAGSPTQLPAYIQTRYEENGVFSRFQNEAEKAASNSAKLFNGAFSEVTKVAKSAASSVASAFGGLDLGVSGMREQAAQANLNTETLKQLARAAQSLANETKDTSASTRAFLSSLSEQVAVSQRVASSINAQIDSYSRLQEKVDSLTASNSRLAEAQRAVYAEQARAARVEVSGRDRQDLWARRFGYDEFSQRERQVGRGSRQKDLESAFGGWSYKADVDLRDAVQRLRDGDAAIDRAAVSGATLEQVLGRVAVKGQAVRDALTEAAKAAAEAARNHPAAGPARANPAPLNNLIGADALVSGQASIDRAAVSGATLESVMGRLSSKGPAVSAALNEAAAAAARLAAEQEKAKVESERFAAAVDRLQAEIDPVYAASQRTASAVKIVQDAFDHGAISADRYKDMMARVEAANHEGTTSFRNVINSQGAMRTAMLQSGQQVQDLAISLYSGQQASVVFAQQLPQLAFALSGLDGSANKTHNRIGKFATFLSGPWGLAVGLAVGVLASLTAQLFSTEDAADETGKAVDRLRDRLDLSKNSYESLIAVVREYNKEQEHTEAVTLAAARAAEKAANALLSKAQAHLADMEASQLSLGGGDEGAALAGKYAAMSATETRIEQLRQDIRDAQRTVADLEVKARLDPVVAAQQDAERRLQVLEEEQKKGIKSAKQYADEKYRIEKELKDKTDALRKSGPSASAQANTGDMVALIKQLFPGATITSTTGGRHIKGSDHYAGRAIDFVPAGGMGAYSTAEVEAILKNAGVDIRRNASGKQQLFGPGRPAAKPGDHDDHFHVAWQGGAPDPDKVAAAAERAKQVLSDFGDRAAESIARVNERFDEQPKLIDQAAQATRQLDAIIKDLSERKPAGFEKMIADAQAAKGVVEDALTKPFREMTKDTGRRLEIERLISEGRGDEAAAMQEVWRLESQIGTLSADQVNAVKTIVTYEQERTRELQRQRALFEAQLEVVDQVRTSMTDLFSGRKTDFLGNIKQAFKDLQGKQLFDRVFGDLFADLEKELRGQSPLGRESQRLADEMSVARGGLEDFTKALGGAATALGNVPSSPAANDNVGAMTFDEAFAAIRNGQTMGWNGRMNPPGTMSLAPGLNDGDEIPVVAKKPIDIAGKSAVNLAEKISAKIVDPFEQVLSKIFGQRFAGMLGGVMKEAMAGYMTGGKTGGVLGTLKGIVDKTGIFGGSAGGVSKTLDAGMGGAATGTQFAGIMKGLGIKTSTNGSQLGGALGAMTGIPGLDIVGSIAGGIIGGMLKKTKWARVLLTSGGASMQSNSKKYQDAVTGAGDDFMSTLNSIADQFNGGVGDFGQISLGVRDGKWRVNTSRASLKKSKGAVGFGEDAEEAMKYALKQAIERGAITGIRESTNRLLQAADDLDAAMKDALDWENVFKDLKRYKDPLGAALDDLDTEFNRLIDIATKAGASTEEWAQLEELYGIKRNEIVKEQAENLIGSLKGLYSDLTTGDNGLSLRARRAAQLDTYNGLATRVAAGDNTAYDAYAEAAQNLLDIEREIYGSMPEFFDRLKEVTDLTKSRIDAETNIVAITQNRDSPFDAAGAVKSSVDNQTEVLGAKLDAMIENQGATLAAIAAMAANGNFNIATARVGFTGNY